MNRLFVMAACCLCLAPFASADNDDNDLPMGGVGGTCHVVAGKPLLEVKSLIAGAPGDAAGLEVGDFITAVHGRPLGTTPTSEQRFSEGYKGAVQDFGIGLDIAQGGTGQLPLKVLRPGQGEVSLNLTLPVIGATGVAFPEAGDFKQLLFDRSCADIHASITASGADLQQIGYNLGWYGLVMLAHPNWNVTTGDKPYGLSVNKMRDYAAFFFWYKTVYDPSTVSGQGSQGDNWWGPQMLMFLSEYKAKAGNVSFTVSNIENGGSPSQTVTISQVIQRGAEILRNRIQDGVSDWQIGPWNGYTTGDGTFVGGHTGHGGHLGEYAGDAPETVTGCLNATAAHILPGLSWAWRSGADFTASQTTQRGGTWTIQQKWARCWEWMKASTMMTAGSTGNERGSVGYMGPDEGWDSALRSSGSYFGFMLHSQERTNATADDTTRSGYQREYVVRNWARQQHAHAYTLGGYVFTQLSIPYFSQREQSFVRENCRFYYSMMRNPDGTIGYFGGRGNNGGDSYCGFDHVKTIYAGLPGAIGSGNLPTLPAPVTTRLLADFKSPWVAWPTLAARSVNITSASQPFAADIRDGAGNLLAPGTYTATWSHVSGPATATFSSTSTANTTATFPSNGTYQIQLVVSRAGYPTITEPINVTRANATTPVAASITQQPVAQSALPGGSATFSVQVSGTGPFVYQWRLDGVPYWGTGASNTLIVSNISPGAAGLYDCVITSPSGALITNAVPLMLNATPVRTLGGLKREVWNGSSGGAISDLTGDATYPRFPDSTTVVSSAEVAENSGDSYGDRLFGWLVPPTTGSYRFFLSADDSAELWLSTDDTPDHKVRLIQQNGWSSFRTYNSASGNVTLTAGQRYYIEVLHKEGGGGDHVSIGWQLPGGSAPAAGSAAIAGTYLEYDDYVLPPEDQWKLDETSSTSVVNAVRTSHNGTHQNGTLVNQAGAATGTGRSAYYDGVNDRSTIPAPNYNTNSLTIAAWVKRNGNVPSWGPIVFSRGGNTVAGFGCGDANELRYHWNDGQWGWNSGLVLPDSQWALAVLVVRPTGATMYLRTASGLQTASQPATALDVEEFDGALSIGTEYVGSSRYFKGNIDDVRIYKGALSQPAVEALWNNAQNPPPQFATSGPFGVSESAAVGSAVGTVSAADPGQTLTYALASGNVGNRFAINSATGQISVAASLDYETTPIYTLTVTATDNGSPVQTATTSVLVNVTNANDAPAFASDPLLAPNAGVGTPYSGTLTASDPDAGDTLSFTKLNGPPWLSIAPDGTLSGTPSQGDAGINNFAVRATDSGNATGTTTLRITVVTLNPVWINATGGSWATGGNWQGGLVAGSADVNAHFETLDLTANAAITLDGDRTLGGLTFGDTTPSHDWTLNTGSGGPLTLAVSNGTPVISVANRFATINAVLAGNQGLAKSGSGTLTLAAANSYTGGTSVNVGELVVKAPSNADWTMAGGAATIATGTTLKLDLSAQTTQYRSTFLGTTAINPGGVLNLHGTVDNVNSHYLIQSWGGATGAGTIRLAGGGSIAVWSGAANPLSGFTGLLDIQGGRFACNINSTATLGGNFDVSIGATGKLDLRSGHFTIDALDGAAGSQVHKSYTGDTINFTLGSGNGGGNFAGAMVGSNYNVIKGGTGTQILGGINTYTGTTAINGGVLLVNGSLGNTATTVAAAGTLGGSGTIAGSVSNSGTFAPGPNGVGNLTINNTLTFAGGSKLAWEIGNWTGAAGTGYDKVTATSLNLTATSANGITLKLAGSSLANFSESSKSFTLVQTSSGITGFSADKFTVDASGLTLPQGTWAVQQSGNNLMLAYTAANPDANSNGILDTWEVARFGNANPGSNLPGDDPDHDGLSNLLEYAFDTHPLTPGVSPIAYDLETLGDGKHLRLTVPKNPAATNLTYSVETCGNLDDWSSSDTTIETNTATQLIVRDNVTSTTATRRFIRLKVTANP
jgi:autotransporter-associated beta strand protein